MHHGIVVLFLIKAVINLVASSSVRHIVMHCYSALSWMCWFNEDLTRTKVKRLSLSLQTVHEYKRAAQLPDPAEGSEVTAPGQQGAAARDSGTNTTCSD